MHREMKVKLSFYFHHDLFASMPLAHVASREANGRFTDWAIRAYEAYQRLDKKQDYQQAEQQ